MLDTCQCMQPYCARYVWQAAYGPHTRRALTVGGAGDARVGVRRVVAPVGTLMAVESVHTG